ncbi:MAG: hypothetical protein IJG86_00205 [Clostridia bacterium]|nr:hypothetical protein [Clostridia bacterium]
MVRTYRQDEKIVRWSQWSPNGMIRCGEKTYGELMRIIQELGKEAKEAVKGQEKPHAVYGRKMHDYTGRLTEIRLYCDAYLDDAELDAVAIVNPLDTFYVAHKQ